jgi:hypothetical protein
MNRTNQPLTLIVASISPAIYYVRKVSQPRQNSGAQTLTLL